MKHFINCVSLQYFVMQQCRSNICRNLTLTSSVHNHSRSPVKMDYSIYDAQDSGSAKTATPIIIMHGFLGSRSNWHTPAKVMQKRLGRKIITVDARNHGNSPHSPETSYFDMASDVLKLMADLGIPKATLIGHSMGGRAMMAVALTEPDLVDKLVSVDVSPVTISPRLNDMEAYFRAMKDVTIEQNATLSDARRLADEQLKDVISDPGVRAFLLMNLKSDDGDIKWGVNIDALSKHLKETIGQFPKFDSRFHGETLFIGGGNSDYIRYSDLPAIQELFPQAEFQSVAGAGHWVHSDKPKDFLNMLCAFLERGPR